MLRSFIFFLAADLPSSFVGPLRWLFLATRELESESESGSNDLPCPKEDQEYFKYRSTSCWTQDIMKHGKYRPCHKGPVF